MTTRSEGSDAGEVPLLAEGGIERHLAGQKEAERCLREGEARRKALFDSGLIGFIFSDSHGNIAEANDEFLRIVGRTREDLESGRVHWIEMTPPEWLPADERGIAEARDHGSCRPYEREFLRKDGERVPVEITYTRLESEQDGVVAHILDLTERKRFEAERDRLVDWLENSEEQFLTLANTIPQLAWMARPDGHIFWYNRRWFEYTGSTLEAMEGWGWQSMHDPEMLPGIIERWKAALATGEPWEDTFPLRRYDGTMRWHLSRAMPVLDEQGRIVRWLGTNTDISELREIQDELRASEERERARAAELEALMNATPAVIWIARDPDCRTITGNAAARG